MGGGAGNILKTVVANVATGGLYSVGKGIQKAVTTGKVLAGGADALANTGPAGGALTPVVGTKKSLLLQGAAAGGALAAAPSGSVLGGTAAAGTEAAAPALGVVGTPAATLAPHAGIMPYTPIAAGSVSVAPVVAGGTPAAAGGITSGQALIGSALLTAGSSAYSAVTNKVPKLPGSPTGAIDPAAVDQAALDAANSVQTADAEARRRRASKRQSSVLSNFQGASQVGISPATLQPAPPRRSVLG